MLTHQLRVEGAVPVAGHRDLDRPHLGQHRLAPPPVPRVFPVAADQIVLGVTKVIVQLALQRGLDDRLGQPGQQPTLPGQLQAPSARARSASC
jgi:hypothetical protein